MWQILLEKLTKNVLREGSISPIKKPQVVILQNWNPRGWLCNLAKKTKTICHLDNVSSESMSKPVHSGLGVGVAMCLLLK